jgi:hypothetical protein
MTQSHATTSIIGAAREMPGYAAAPSPKPLACAARVTALMITVGLVSAVGASAAAADSGGYPYATVPCVYSPCATTGSG